MIRRQGHVVSPGKGRDGQCSDEPDLTDGAIILLQTLRNAEVNPGHGHRRAGLCATQFQIKLMTTLSSAFPRKKYSSQACAEAADSLDAVQAFQPKENHMSVQAVSQSTVQTAGPTASTTTGTKETQPATASTSSKPAGTGTTPTSYSVSISSAARAALTEATETSVQTAKEAGSGDLQAQRLLTKEAAAKAG